MIAITKRTITDLGGTKPYLVRWSMWLPGGWSLKLHQILRRDDDRCAHDHPWWFVRIILFGGYVEEVGTRRVEHVCKPWRPWAPWRVYYCGPSFRHRITRLLRDSSWTLVLAGPSVRKWGFFTTSGWVHWKAFVSAARARRVLWCDDGRSLDGDQGEFPLAVVNVQESKL